MEQKNQKLMIFLAGDLRSKDNLLRRIQTKSFDYYAADAGYHYAKELGLPLKRVLGDFDSMEQPDAPHLAVFPAEKDETDSELALRFAIQDGYTEIWMIAPFGGRMDHTVANLHLLEEARKNGVSLILYDGENEIQLVGKGTYTFSRELRYLSFFPWGEEAVISLKDMKYPLEEYRLLKGKTIGTSNEPAGEHPTLVVHSGGVLCICIEHIQEEL